MSNVFWITGLSGAGKTTIGEKLYEHLKQAHPAVVLLDGDTLRAVFHEVFGYSEDDRRAGAMCYARLCNMLSEQGITVVCCTVSMFDIVRDWNRENIHGYVEVYVKVSLETLLARDQKGLYSGFKKGTSSEVVGMDIQMEEPKAPDVVIENDGHLSIDECVNKILETIGGI